MLPYAPEAEQSVLGNLLLAEPITVATVLGELTADDFHLERHRAVFVAAGLLHARGEAIDTVAVYEQTRLAGDDEKVGGLAGVAELLDASLSAASVEHHIRIIRDRAVRRRLYQAAQGIMTDATSNDADCGELVSRAEQRVFAVAHGASGGGIVAARDVMWDVLGLIEKGGVPTIPTGIASFDRRFGGTRPGQLTIIAGATSMGKSSFALQLAHHSATSLGEPTAIFSIEMTTTENLIRMVANDAMLDLHATLSGSLSDADLIKIAPAATRIHTAPLYLDDSATRATEIRARARRLKAEKGLRMVVVDHMHDMEEVGDSRREQLGTIARTLRLMAKELDVVVIAVSQLSRAPSQRADHRPQLSDLRETGDLEAAANTVIFVHRPEYYLGPKGKDGEDLRGQAEAIVAKNRNGPTGSVPLRFYAYCTRFDEPRDEWRRDFE